MAVKIEVVGEKVIATDAASVESLNKGSFGLPVEGKKDKLWLLPEEALYLADVRGAEITRNSTRIDFNQLAFPYREGPKFLARYFTYRDWRDRGLIARPINEAEGNYGRSPVVHYPSKDLQAPKIQGKALFFKDDLMAVIDDEEDKNLFEKLWFGQWGTYKAKKHGRLLKLDSYETLFLMRHAHLKCNVQEKRIVKEALERRPDFLSLYSVYEDFRLRGFVVKTGFKFGTHFRLYFPGAAPSLGEGEWVHSKHVIHVFPREAKMLISEWSRAIRVAHGVKKTFILAIPGEKRVEKEELDFLLYHRKKGGLIENPREDKPKFVMMALSEEEEIGGAELARAIERAKQMGLDLMLAICDRETSITYYRVKRIELPKSRFEYYEIEWSQP
ncbi:TPA: tRNA-intron lyase [Candidatus Micrarchaeota archaeon]|nr:tRNA-intron lyase [Candidatus Micrarchaeota archaeon]